MTKDTSRRGLFENVAFAGSGALGLARLSAQVPTVSKTLAVERARLATRPIEATKLTNFLTLFTGPGGNVLVRNGEDGKVVVDTFVQGAFPALKERIDAMGSAPILYLINTHWHFDHTDNNESFRNAGVEIVAHENTKRRLSETRDLLGIHFDPAPAAALPVRTFAQTCDVKFTMSGAEEYLDLGYLPRAHTDTDIYVHFVMGDVLHLGDTFFNGMYPVIDVGTGGSVNGMIAAAVEALRMMNSGTKIVPGHGPMGDRAALMSYRDMLVTVRDRVQRLKAAGRTEQDVVGGKPTTDLDGVWGKGPTSADAFVSTVYQTL